MGCKEALTRDRIAVGLAASAVLMLFVFFYALHQNVSGLSAEIEELKRLNAAVLELDARHAGVDSRVTALQALPRKTEVMALENQVNAMAHATSDLDQRLDGKHREELRVIQGLLEKIASELHEEK